MSELKYGPVGDPDSSDMWERAQARMPKDWHVEGQIIYTSKGYRAQATSRTVSYSVYAYGANGSEALDALVEAVSR